MLDADELKKLFAVKKTLPLRCCSASENMLDLLLPLCVLSVLSIRRFSAEGHLDARIW